jgi:hypothetical protein
MLTPLYPIGLAPTIITVAAPGALAGEESLPVAALETALPLGYILDFGTAKFAKLTAAGAVDDEELDVEELPTALDPGDEANVPGSQAATLLGGPTGTWAKLPDDETRLAYQLAAELLLDLRAPVYTGTDADELGFAIVHQLLFMLAHGLTPSIVKSIAQGGPSVQTKTFRDRWIDPSAAAIVARVTGRKAMRFEPFLAGV